MALRKIVDDTIITTDAEGDRMYFNITDNLRLRSSDPYNVVMERYRLVENKGAPSRMDWVFEGYYPSHLHIFAQAKAYTSAHKAWGRKFTRTQAQEHMVSKYFDVWQYVNTSSLKVEDVSKFIKEAKEHEFNKSSAQSLKAAEARKTKKAQDQA